ncbi:ABC transporter substrate-binding protein [Nonomuraea soli]|uniref:Multiple sugar transport system substrate-binding protein n=1 Tax=Nonomuraea soli TaxID=1032476 RepID=A0A7W0CS43_9ACTN|nr:extracellular solute-binding protein [Nonomuraea soli]MBA2896189.1 multiple sugar transport system substrate-binding protein [Nonomuraea soli]
MWAKLKIGVAGAAALALATACGGGETPAAPTGGETLTLQTNWTTAGTESVPLKKALAAFTQKTGIQVKVLENGDDLNQVYETALLAGQEADVLLVGLLEKQLDWVKNGAVVPVEDYVGAWGLQEEIPAEALADWKDAQGHLRGLPYAGFTWPWWYNKALFDKHGIALPATADDLVAAAGKLRKAGVGPVAIGGNDWSGQKVFMQIMETYLDAESAKKVFAEGETCASPAAMKGIELFVKLREAGVFVDGVEGLTADQAGAMYQDGSAAIAPLGSWSYVSTEPALAETTVLGGFPVATGGTYGKPTAFRGSTSAGWWISPNGKKKIDAVKQLMQHMYSPEVLQSMAVDGGVVMATATEVDTAKMTSPLLAQSVTALPSAVDFAVMPDLYVPADVGNPLYRATSIAYTKGNDAKKICAAVDDVYRAAK